MRVWCGALALLLASLAQGAEPPPITPLRQKEDYRYLAIPENRQGTWWEPLKYIPFNPLPESPFLSLGAEVRVRYEWIDNTDFGSGPQDKGGYILTRYMPYVSLNVPSLPGDAEFQVFGQAILAFSDGDARGEGPIDEDSFDFLQAFARLTFPLAGGMASIQAGRQHISFGSERLLGTRYGPNVPLSFDGGLAHWENPLWNVHGFYLRPVQVAADELDNVSSADQQLWGIYLTRNLRDLLPGIDFLAIDTYYLGLSDANAEYNSGSGRELRHTLGTRLFGRERLPAGTFDWNYEAMLQFGSFDTARGHGSILAWSIGTETGWQPDLPLEPRFSLRANAISGDRNPSDANLQTFSPLFPKGKYFGELTPVGPYNLLNLLGGVAIAPTVQTSLSIQGGPYWRFSTGDAVYGVGGNIVRSPPGGSRGANFIGTQLEFVAEWKPRRELSFLASYSQFMPGGFIEQSGPSKTIYFFALEAVFQF